MDERLGAITLRMDGRWDIEDLGFVADGLGGIYGYFYALLIDDSDNHAAHLRRRIDDLVTSRFWNQPFGASHVGEQIYGWIPSNHGLKIQRITYASPGIMEIMGILGVLMLMAKVVQAWTKAGSDIFTLYEKVDKFFADRPLLRRPPRNFNLGNISGRDIDDAHELMFELGREIGLSDPMLQRTLDMCQNPISGLRFVVALAVQAKNVAALQNRGLLELPAAPHEVAKSKDPAPRT